MVSAATSLSSSQALFWLVQIVFSFPNSKGSQLQKNYRNLANRFVAPIARDRERVVVTDSTQTPSPMTRG